MLLNQKNNISNIMYKILLFILTFIILIPMQINIFNFNIKLTLMFILSLSIFSIILILMKKKINKIVDHVSTILSNLIHIPGMPDKWTGGGMLLIWIEYGFLSFLLFSFVSFKLIFEKGNLLTIVFWFFLIFLYGVNSQIVWITIILLFTTKYFKKKRNTF